MPHTPTRLSDTFRPPRAVRAFSAHATSAVAVRAHRLLSKFGLDESAIELKINRRGAAPKGGGEVIFRCPTTRELVPVDLTDEGFVKRIRGVAYATRVSPSMSNRIVDSARGVLNSFIPDVYIYTDHYRGPDSGNSPGYGLSLVAETTTGCALATEVMSSAASSARNTADGETAVDSQSPEAIGLRAAKLLLQDIKHGGCVDSTNQWLALLFMALCPEDISRMRLGKLSEYTINYLRLLRDVFDVTFKLATDTSTLTPTVLVSCRGIGWANLSRRAA